MKKLAEGHQVHVSKTLFMDLAFLLIAAILPLTHEPSKKDNTRQLMVDPSFIRIRSVSTRDIIEKNLPGESLFLQIQASGSMQELLSNGSAHPLPLADLPTRVMQMPGDGRRVIVLVPNKDVLYASVAEVRDVLSGMMRDGSVSALYEVTGEVP